MLTRLAFVPLVPLVTLVTLVALTLHLVGCALPAREAPGAVQSEVIARLGPSTAIFALPSGHLRLYCGLPAGFAAYNLNFDATGRLVPNKQVLTHTRFQNIPARVWTLADVQSTYGPPLPVERVSRFDGDIWTYRFRQNSDPRLAHAQMERKEIVRVMRFTNNLPLFDNARA